MVSRIVAAFQNICNKTWRRLRATESLKFGIENASGGIKARENDQPEEISNARNGSGHDDNKGENFDDEKHCKTMNEVSINNNERQSKNKNRALHFAESKTFREQMEEIVATTEGTKTKTLPKGRTGSPSDGTIFQEV